MAPPRKPESEKLVRRDAWALPRTWQSIDEEAKARNISRQYIIRQRLEATDTECGGDFAEANKNQGEKMSEAIERPAYQTRVIEEKAELDAKIQKLFAFLEGKPAIEDRAAELLNAQLGTMVTYSSILEARIDLF